MQQKLNVSVIMFWWGISSAGLTEAYFFRRPVMRLPVSKSLLRWLQENRTHSNAIVHSRTFWMVTFMSMDQLGEDLSKWDVQLFVVFSDCALNQWRWVRSISKHTYWQVLHHYCLISGEMIAFDSTENAFDFDNQDKQLLLTIYESVISPSL